MQFTFCSRSYSFALDLLVNTRYKCYNLQYYTLLFHSLALKFFEEFVRRLFAPGSLPHGLIARPGGEVSPPVLQGPADLSVVAVVTVGERENR